MSNTININDFKKPPTMKKQVDIDDLKPIHCEECGNNSFQQGVKLYRMSAIQSPNGQAGMVQLPIIMCVNCGTIVNVQEILK
jgi:hypothetical protein